jgi:hypothetical protein
LVAESVPLLVLKQCFSRGLQALLGYKQWHTEFFNRLLEDPVAIAGGANHDQDARGAN